VNTSQIVNPSIRRGKATGFRSRLVLVAMTMLLIVQASFGQVSVPQTTEGAPNQIHGGEPELSQWVPRSSNFGSPYVPLDSDLYVWIDRLAALGYAPTAYGNLQPWTRIECARITVAAGELLAGEDEKSQARELYAALKVELGPELAEMKGATRPVFRMESLYERYTGIAGTPLEDGYHFGQTLINDFGRPYGVGSNVVMGASAFASRGSLAAYARAEYQRAGALEPYTDSTQQLIGIIDHTGPQLPIHTSTINRVRVLEAYVAWNFKNVELSIGRQSLNWGPGRSGSLMFSTNAEPIDMLRLSKTSPWRLPGFLSSLGPVRWDAFVGLLAGHHFPKGPAIQGQKISLKPTPNLEFGFSRTIVFRPVTFRQFGRSFASVGDNLGTVPGSSLDVGDRRGGFDFSYRVPGLRKWVVLYSNSLTDDDPSPLAAPQRSIINPGIYLPQIPKIPKLDLRIEAPFSDGAATTRFAGRFFYWNAAFHDSYTNNGNLLGSWVGRQGDGLYLLSTYWFSPQRSIAVQLREANVDRNFIPSGGKIRDISIRSVFPIRSNIYLDSFVQYERWNFPALSQVPASNTAVSVQLTYRPESGKRSR
jgi:hypothetical protein